MRNSYVRLKKRFKGGNNIEQPIYVNIDCIVSMEPGDTFTIINLSNGKEYCVSDSIRNIKRKIQRVLDSESIAVATPKLTLGDEIKYGKKTK